MALDQTPFEYACRTGDLEMVIRLKHSMNLQAGRYDFPLREAAQHGHLAVVRYLVEHWYSNESLLFPITNAARNGHTEVVQYLLSQCKEKYKMSVDWALQACSENGHVLLVKYLLLNYPHEDNKNILLIGASAGGHISLVRYAVEVLKADVTICDSVAICRASFSGSLPVIKYLVEHGANVNSKNGYPLLQAVRFDQRDGFPGGYFDKFPVRHGIDTIRYLLDHNATIDNQTLIHACVRGDLDIVKLLVNRGADLYTSQQVCMDRARKAGHNHIVKWLMKQVVLEN